MKSLFSFDLIEVTGVIFTLIFLFLEIRGKWMMWVVGIASAMFYVYINMEQRLYAMMGLSVYNAFICGYGLYCWRFMRRGKETGLRFSYVTANLCRYLWMAGISIYFFSGLVILLFTDIESPLSSIGALFSFVLDSLIMTLSIVATWMAARKLVESWFLWMVVNPCTIAIYLYKGMMPSVLLYVVYSVFSVLGYIQWKKMAAAQ
ncbi:MAG: nicotinamide riboside transporter PnuC [Dysgonamonadaceae bacterium]|jgi:nicotinamide mononucleotide transporter|nr:nicotinamide riboside transporter PnuC [Dysgonamonadaceae bacterium]